jgi:hypothetical protein
MLTKPTKRAKGPAQCALVGSKGVQIIHVNKNTIFGNLKRGENKPPLIVRGKSRSQKVKYGHEVNLYHKGELVAKFVYRPDCPLDCGARVWFESDKLTMVPIRKD